MEPKLTFHRLAREDLFGIYDYIDTEAGAVRAGRYVERIEAVCRRLTNMPMKGVSRDDLSPGLRTWTMERRVLIAYRIDGADVEVLRILYAGRDFQAADVPH